MMSGRTAFTWAMSFFSRGWIHRPYSSRLIMMLRCMPMSSPRNRMSQPALAYRRARWVLMAATRSRMAAAISSSHTMSIIRFSMPRMYQEVSQMVALHVAHRRDAPLVQRLHPPGRPPLFFSE